MGRAAPSGVSAFPIVPFLFLSSARQGLLTDRYAPSAPTFLVSASDGGLSSVASCRSIGMEMKWLTLPARFFGSTNSEDATSPLQPVWACVRYGARSSIGVHMPKCANTALKTVPRTAKAMMTIALELTLERVRFLSRRSPDMLHSPPDFPRADTRGAVDGGA
jgi:hypothetical protein